MVKYALILAFTYSKNPYAAYDLTKLTCTTHDINMIYNLCKKFNIEDNNITIITDLTNLPSKIYNCNVKVNNYPDDIFVCREISQFIENTIRGIEENVYKDDSSNYEILLYISGHGSEIKINDKNEQAIILTGDDGTSLRYLLSKDLFKMIFGNFDVTELGAMNIPIYKKIPKYKRVDTDTSKYLKVENIGEEHFVSVQLQPSINSPHNSPGIIVKPYRSSYLANRGIPFYSKLLAIIDTCYSAHMTQFPFIYDPRSQIMNEAPDYNIDIHSDLPYCIAISSCESNKTSRFTSSGSSLTNILHMNLMKYDGNLNICQLHYLIYNTENNIINHILRTQSSHPIITSTSVYSDSKIPFFSNDEQKSIKIISK